MKLRLTLQRPDRSTIDIAVTAEMSATIGNLADAIIERDASGAFRDGTLKTGEVTLEVSSHVQTEQTVVLDPNETLADVALAAAVNVTVVPVQRVPKIPVAYIEVYGASRNKRFEIARGATTIGRDVVNDIVLDDPQISKRHARVHVGPDHIELVDLNSANGIIVQGEPVQRLELHAGQEAQLGGTLVRAGFLAQQPISNPVISEIVFTRSPSVEPRYIGREIEGIDPPAQPEPQPFPWLAMVVPLIAGVAMFAVTRSALSIVFVAMSPLLMLGTWFTARSTKRKKVKEDRARFDQQLQRLSTRLENENAEETRVRRAESPSLEELYAAVLSQDRSLWKLRPEHWTFPHLRFGIGTAPSRNTVKTPTNPDRAEPEDIEAIEAVIGKYRDVVDVPIVENFDDAGAIGLCGSPEWVAWYARGLAAQIAATRGPQEFVMCGMFGPAWSEQFFPLKWFPHTMQSEPYFSGAPLADTASAAMHVLSSLEEIINARSPRGNTEPEKLGPMSVELSAMNSGEKVGKKGVSDTPASPLPAVLVFISDDAPVERARLVQLLEQAAGRGVYPIWLAHDRSQVPAACRTFVEFDEQAGPRVGFVRLGTTIEPLQPEGLSREQFFTFARKIAAYVDAGTTQQQASNVPQSVSLLSLIGEEMATQPDAVLDRWQQNGSLIEAGMSVRNTPPKLRAIVGQAADGSMHLDLRAQGPHALVGGTTGSGKSEFLQAWVLGMAAEYSPQRVTFLFVDYKGGAAFADCVNLPHCVGLVTDLSPHLVRRALISLRAELHYRERLFTQKKAKDLIELEKRADPEAPPALVIVIDEFAALVSEVPEFVDGVVDVAQRGRSLGIHLILATQRPAGVIKDNLRANTNLRIGLRMADESDSEDVVGDKLAAHFDPGVPGRTAAKTGPGRLSIFQSAYSGGWSFADQKTPQIELASFHFGPEQRWEQSDTSTTRDDTNSDIGPNDQQRLVSTIVAAAQQRRIPAPRRPWLDELAQIYDLTKLSQRTDAQLVLGVRDVPQHQAQETAYFEPDLHGHLAVFGTGGSGKSVTLRTLAIAAGITPRGGPVDVYALDFGAGGMRMLEELPHVGAVIGADASERVRNLFKMLREELQRRSEAYAAVNAGTITQFRDITRQADERRILLLIDGFPTFRSDYEGISGRAESYEAFQQVMRDGRSVGIHVALTADRAQSVPPSLQALIQQRVVLRMADTDGYAMLGVARDVLDADSVPGRAIIDGAEAQIATIGGTNSITEQAEATKAFAQALENQGRQPARPVRALPELCTLEELPATVDDRPVLGLSEIDLGPIGFEPNGLFVVAGGPGSGRTNATAALALSLKRSEAVTKMVLLSSPRSVLSSLINWDEVATDPISTAALVDSLLSSGEPLDGLAVFVEGVSELSNSMAEMALNTLASRAKRGECLIVSDGDTTEWHTGFGLIGALKASRRGVVLAPDMHDGEMIFKTAFPRLQRREFPPGRAMYVLSGKAVRVQLPLVLDS